MADPDETNSAVIQIASTQETLRRSLASGKVPVEDEIRARAGLASLLIDTFPLIPRESYIHDAIDQLDTVLRRLPKDSPDRAKHLDSLSFAAMSLYNVKGSRHVLDQAVLYGCQARDSAMATRLLDRDSATYFKILTNLGYALSHRYRLTDDVEDLDQASECAREIYRTAPKDSDTYQLTLNNLSSRLRQKYLRDKSPETREEARELLNELLDSSAPGTAQHGMAMMQLCASSVDAFKETGLLADLDEAIRYCKMALDALPDDFETQRAPLNEIVRLSKARHRKTNSEADLETVLQFSGLRCKKTPLSHSTRGEHLLDHFLSLQKHAFSTQSLAVTETAIVQMEDMLNATPIEFPQKRQCRATLANLLGKRYLLSTDLDHFSYLLRYTRDLYIGINGMSLRAGSSTFNLSTDWLSILTKTANSIARAPAENAMRKRAERALPQLFRSCCQAEQTAISGLQRLFNDHSSHLHVLAEAATAGCVLSDDEVKYEVAKLDGATAPASAPARNSRESRPPASGLSSFLGFPMIAKDPKSGEAVVDASKTWEKVLGYDPKAHVSPEEFVAREARIERETIDKLRMAGRHPNPKLCRLCRDVAKPLKPVGEDLWVFTASSFSLLPFGSFSQLKYQRQNCAICRLILSIISMPSGQLHPFLGSIKQEIQGTRLSTDRLSTGETVMRIDYGLKHVGELRIVTRTNFDRALRQAREVGFIPLGKLDFYDLVEFPRILQDTTGPVFRRGGQQVNLRMVKAWLNDCDHNHGSACNMPRSGTRAEKDIPLNLIDVVQGCLVPATSDEKYFALSYVWGKSMGASKTLRSNYEARQQARSLSAVALPRTIKDAMALARELGERFLWVDAVCMVQDNAEEMARDIPNMDIVYGQAFATIVGLHGDDADAGLPGVMPGTRAPQPVETLTVSNRSPELDHDTSKGDGSSTKIYLTATPVPLDLALEGSKWNTRGWILQERLLSRRCLYFSHDTVYFDCGRETRCEGGANEYFRAYSGSEAAPSDGQLVGSASRDNPLLNLATLYDLTPRARLGRVFHVYSKLVESYSQRSFSFKADILRGFAGMFAVLDEHLHSTTLHGLPAAVFSHALLWTPAARLPRRGTELPTSLQSTLGDPDRQFPSWSWAGWDGPAEYRVFEEAHGGGEFLLPTPLVKRFETVSSGGESIDTPNTTAKKQSNDTPPVQGTTTAPSPPQPADRVLARLLPDPDRNSSWWIVPPSAMPQAESAPLPRHTVLRFSAPCVPFASFFAVAPAREYLSAAAHGFTQSAQPVRRLFARDARGQHTRHCGLWWEQAGYGYVGRGDSQAEKALVMVGVSASYQYHGRQERGLNRVEGEIRMFDEAAFRDETAGDASATGWVNILVVDEDMGHADGTAERCTVAVVHARAWREAGPAVRVVQLA
ncbi:heterokaryon incompatibility protein-domain-containing protein [Lasiosphaeria ovina]|uniref:Heterokaryon incompatibility protein-domain-containing protein n=1 Tax=Lasiosphaeria ovina TaxID=92902 RepID=A0AAE0N4S5_9PEZI|nr:heterokaryon incompatibility protein-domain-containing protein [Lasiosphaeria ovina]